MLTLGQATSGIINMIKRRSKTSRLLQWQTCSPTLNCSQSRNLATVACIVHTTYREQSAPHISHSGLHDRAHSNVRCTCARYSLQWSTFYSSVLHIVQKRELHVPTLSLLIIKKKKRGSVLAEPSPPPDKKVTILQDVLFHFQGLRIINLGERTVEISVPKWV